MRIGRLRAGELLALVGAVGLFVVLFLDWFGVDGARLGWRAYRPLGHGASLHHTGWMALDWPIVALAAISIGGGLAVAWLCVRGATPASAVGACVVTWVLGAVAFAALLVDVLLQPGLGAGLPNAGVTVQAAAYAGLACAALIPIGAWTALRDERLDAPESAYTPPPPRPVPGTAH